MSIEAKDDGGGGNNWTTGAISRAKLQPNHHHQHPVFLQAGCPCLPTNSVKALKGKKYHNPMDLLTPSSPGVFQLCLTTNSSWLTWGRVAMPLISPLMPVLLVHCSLQTVVNKSFFFILEQCFSLLQCHVVLVYQRPEFIRQQWTWHGPRVLASLIKSSSGCEGKTKGQA